MIPVHKKVEEKKINFEEILKPAIEAFKKRIVLHILEGVKILNQGVEKSVDIKPGFMDEEYPVDNTLGEIANYYRVLYYPKSKSAFFGEINPTRDFRFGWEIHQWDEEQNGKSIYKEVAAEFLKRGYIVEYYDQGRRREGGDSQRVSFQVKVSE